MKAQPINGTSKKENIMLVELDNRTYVNPDHVVAVNKGSKTDPEGSTSVKVVTGDTYVVEIPVSRVVSILQNAEAEKQRPQLHAGRV
jgi:hypothetical protein